MTAPMFVGRCKAPMVAPSFPELRGRRFQFLASQYFVIGGALFLGVIVPELLHPWIRSLQGRPHGPAFAKFEAIFVAAIFAILIGHVSLARVTSLPTINAKTYILPAFLMSYAAVLSGIYLTNTLFGRYYLVLSFALVIAWYFAAAVIHGRHVRTRIALIGESNHPITGIQSTIGWIALPEPVLLSPVSAIVVDTRSHLTPAWEHFIAAAVLNGIPVHDTRHMMEVLSGRVEIRHMADNSFGSILPASDYIRVKRLIDLLIAIPAVFLILPVIGLFALLIRMESKGPAIFRQKRTGYRGEPFTCYKLRSMRIEHNGPHFTLEGDERITRIGRFIRKFRIDELPQILNIIKGDMSWIGPRPESVPLAELYESEIPFYVYRHAVRPGISGWAAVHQGNVGNVDAAAIKLQYDFFYIKYCSMWVDTLIIFKTIRAVLTGFGAR